MVLQDGEIRAMDTVAALAANDRFYRESLAVVRAQLVRTALVTGVAGFIGSTLAERLVADGWSVRGVDRFTAYYEEAIKRSNIAGVLDDPNFELVEADLRTADLAPLLDGVDVVFHEAGQPGIRLSWADGFALYNELNVNVTQRLLEAVRQRPVERFVFASSSSVYGTAERYPTSERDPTQPHNPYGITKLAAELLCRAYSANFGVPTVALRYFTVYGPRQRPDMAIHRLVEAARTGRPFSLFGNGAAGAGLHVHRRRRRGDGACGDRRSRAGHRDQHRRRRKHEHARPDRDHRRSHRHRGAGRRDVTLRPAMSPAPAVTCRSPRRCSDGSPRSPSSMGSPGRSRGTSVATS